MNSITIEWVKDEGAYIVRQNGEFIKDTDLLDHAARFALEVQENFPGTIVEIISVRP